MENKFLKRFDLVKTKFNKKLKDNLFTEEIKAFKKYNIIDENNMFNYIYVHNIYQNLIEKPLEYKINIICKKNEQISQFLNNIFNEQDLNFEHIMNFSYKTYINFADKNKNNLYNLYLYEKQEKKIILNNKSINEIIDYLKNEENKHENINKNNEIFITSENFKFNSYPSIQFNIYFRDKYEDNLVLIKESLEKDYIEKNEKRISLEKDILDKYFNNKNTLYLNDQIYYRNTSLLSTINIFFNNDEE